MNSVLAKTKRALQTDLVKVSSWSALATAIKMATSLVLSKLLATTVGTAGVALIGQLMNGVAIFLNLSNGAINVGITKYAAEYENQPEKRQQLINTSLAITVACSLITGLLLAIFSRPLSQYLLQDTHYAYIIVTLGATLWLYALNINLLAIANGLKQYRIYIIANIASSLLGLLFTFLMVKKAGLPGALLAAATFQSLVVFVTAGLIYYKQKNLYFTGWAFNRPIARLLLGFSAMSLVSAIVLPWSQIAVRNLIAGRIDIHAAGLWESMNRISFAYLSIITLGLQTYFLPKLSSINDKRLLRHEIGRAYKLVLPVLLVMSVGIYLGRDLVIRLLFTPSFGEMRSLFVWQLAGDFVKICGWLLAVLFWAKGMTRWFIVTEIYFPLQYYFLTHLCLQKFGLQGACIAHLINYSLYFIATYSIIKAKKVI
jgi:O-antigen/teichoic acid export membrane protein